MKGSAWGHAILYLAEHVLPLAAAFIASVSDHLNAPDPNRESSELSVTCAKLLAEPSGAPRAGNVVKLGRHSVATTVEIERIERSPNPSRTIAEVRVRMDVDGQPVPALTTRGVGIEATRGRALEAARRLVAPLRQDHRRCPRRGEHGPAGWRLRGVCGGSRIP